MKPIEKWLWASAAEALSIRGGLFCLVDSGEDKRVISLSAYSVPIEPFNGSENSALADVIREVRKVGHSHEHSIKKWALSNILPRMGVPGGCCAVVLHTEIKHENRSFCFLGFPKNNSRCTESVARVKGVAIAFADYFCNALDAMEYRNRLEIVEQYTKEVGHDLANATQALLAKLRVISDIDLEIDAIKRKSEECIGEVKQLYGIADGLGLAIEKNYRARSSISFGINALVEEVVSHLRSEADEHKISFCIKCPRDCQVKGDKAAIRLAIQQLLGNAIKYSHPDREVTIVIRAEDDQVVVMVSNDGIGLPKGPDVSKIYEFGFRSTLAKSRHVNGSGIGLYTCRKIAIAHSGRLWHEERNGITTFCFAIPPAPHKCWRSKRKK